FVLKRCTGVRIPQAGTNFSNEICTQQMFTIDFHGEGITSCNKNQTRKIIICVITGGRTSCESARVGTTALPISAVKQ
ncbi:hypothetical protein NL311_27395, partial [Klebsiella pneumoniae]|nr:hypothetical protein [Klebsiella pneumoniae]